MNHIAHLREIFLSLVWSLVQPTRPLSRIGPHAQTKYVREIAAILSLQRRREKSSFIILNYTRNEKNRPKNFLSLSLRVAFGFCGFCRVWSLMMRFFFKIMQRPKTMIFSHFPPFILVRNKRNALRFIGKILNFSSCHFFLAEKMPEIDKKRKIQMASRNEIGTPPPKEEWNIWMLESEEFENCPLIVCCRRRIAFQGRFERKSRDLPPPSAAIRHTPVHMYVCVRRSTIDMLTVDYRLNEERERTMKRPKDEMEVTDRDLLLLSAFRGQRFILPPFV